MKRPDFYFADHPLGSKEWLIGTKQLADYFKVTTRTIAKSADRRAAAPKRDRREARRMVAD
jgi:hypothetical protein